MTVPAAGISHSPTDGSAAGSAPGIGNSATAGSVAESVAGIGHCH